MTEPAKIELAILKRLGLALRELGVPDEENRKLLCLLYLELNDLIHSVENVLSRRVKSAIKAVFP